MFTGIIESICTVKTARPSRGGMLLELDLCSLAADAKLGDSIAVNGACLTITKLAGQIAGFDISSETLEKSTLSSLRSGSKVNAERAMRADGRFGGHIVQGHIDATGKIKKIEKKGDFWQFVFESPKEIQDFLIPKGSIAVDGVSLTIADIEKNNFDVAIIPATFGSTIFKNYKVGDLVNIETDIICRIVKKQLENILPTKSNLRIDKLKEMGF